MKNKIENTPCLQKEIVKGETTEVMETVLFTNTIEKEIKAESPLKYGEYLSFIAHENMIKLFVTPSLIYGKATDIEKTLGLLVDAVMYN